MMEKLETDGIVPDVIDKPLSGLVRVFYSNEKRVDLGNELTPTEVKDQPNVSWNASPDCYYTLCMTDPDAPSRAKPDFREWHHWLVGNIPNNDISKGDVLSAYIGAGPPENTGLHRYVFLVYKQPSKITFTEPILTNTSGLNREKFSIRTFAQKYSLGEPIAVNYFQAKWDTYVPILYKQLGG